MMYASFDHIDFELKPHKKPARSMNSLQVEVSRQYGIDTGTAQANEI